MEKLKQIFQTIWPTFKLIVIMPALLAVAVYIIDYKPTNATNTYPSSYSYDDDPAYNNSFYLID